MTLIKQFLVSISFFTRISLAQPTTTPLSQLVWTFPVVGGLLGALFGLFYQLCYAAGFAAPIATLATLGLQLWLTRGMQEEALTRCIDGFAGGDEKESRLAAMRDARIGRQGTAALILCLLLKATSLTLLERPELVMAALIVTGAMSRSMMALAMYAMPSARADGLPVWNGKPKILSMYISVISACLMTLLLLRMPGLALVACAIVVCDVICLIAKRKIDGITPDVLGAIAQAVEVTLLVVATQVLHA